MNDLIEALQIFQSIANSEYPTHCAHEILLIMDIAEDDVSEAQAKQLDKLGFHWSTEYDCWGSFRFGSA